MNDIGKRFKIFCCLYPTLFLTYDIMSAKGRIKCPNGQLPSVLKQMYVWTFDERSEPEKLQVFRVSARNLR